MESKFQHLEIAVLLIMVETFLEDSFAVRGPQLCYRNGVLFSQGSFHKFIFLPSLTRKEIFLVKIFLYFLILL